MYSLCYKGGVDLGVAVSRSDQPGALTHGLAVDMSTAVPRLDSCEQIAQPGEAIESHIQL